MTTIVILRKVNFRGKKEVMIKGHYLAFKITIIGDLFSPFKTMLILVINRLDLDN